MGGACTRVHADHTAGPELWEPLLMAAMPQAALPAVTLLSGTAG